MQAVWNNGAKTLTFTFNSTESPEMNALLNVYNIPTTVPAADATLDEGSWSHIVDVLKHLVSLGTAKLSAAQVTANVIRKNH